MRVSDSCRLEEFVLCWVISQEKSLFHQSYHFIDYALTYRGQQHCAFSCSCPSTAINRIHTHISFWRQSVHDAFFMFCLLPPMGEHIAGVWVHACLSLCFMAGRWFNGASVWMDGTLRENKSKSTLARAQGLLQHIVMLNTGFSFRTILSEPWCVLKTAYCGIDLTQYVNYQIYSITL